MEPTKLDQLSDMELPAIFPENRVPALPMDEEGNPPDPNTNFFLPLPIKEQRPRVVIVDDDNEVIDGLKRSHESFYSNALDVRFLRPSHERRFADQIKNWMKEGWRPDAIVIDINMDIGGRHGVHYLQELREERGCVALAVVLTTASQYRDIDKGELTVGHNLTREDPAQWIEHARKYEPEGVLYNKTANAPFLGRIGEHLPEWHQAARRRTWVKLLGEVALVLDGRSIKLETVAKTIVDFVVAEMEIDDAFVRWRRDKDKYELVAVATTREQHYVNIGELIDPKSVPVLNDILEKNRAPVIKEKLNKDEAGAFTAQIAGFRFLGVGMVLGNQPVGFITLLRSPSKRVFEEDIDGQHLAVLARLLASALGRDALMRRRQTRLLAFANSVAQASQLETVCDALATTLHQELHENSDSNSKTTVRLLDFGKGVLKRHTRKGMPSAQVDIAITEAQSIYAKCVRDKTLYRIDDVTLARWENTYLDLCEVSGVHSVLCVPLTIAGHAIGAVNSEHLERDFYRVHDEDFVRAAAGLAANAIERIRTTHVLVGMTDFVHRFAREQTGDLDRRLRELLYDYSSYSVLVDLYLNNEAPWIVKHVDCKFIGTNKEEIYRQLTNSYADKWEKTWLSTLHRDRAWKQAWAHFTTDDKKFLHIFLSNQDGQGVHQKADAFLWLRRGEAAPHRALLLMWYLPPPINEESIELLGSLAKLFSELDMRRQRIDELIEENLVGEQAKQIGHVMQHFRHRLGNLTGSMETHINRVEEAHQEGNEGSFNNAIKDVRDKVRDIANSFHKSKGYIKLPKMEKVSLQDIIKIVCTSKDIEHRIKRIALKIEVPTSQQIYTDVEIASLVLFSVFENALDAIEIQEHQAVNLRSEIREKSVILAVMDNGPGVQTDRRQHLFEWGATTKQDGLGSALAFARNRMRVLKGDLFFPPIQPSVGALFELQFPSDPCESSQ